MCISNNRRPYPTNGFKSRVGVMAPTFPSGAANLKDALLATTSPTAHKSSSSSSSSPPPGSKNHHIVVQHKAYVDHANDNRADYKEDLPARGGVTVPFPIRLHEMLDAVERDGYAHVISWASHGRCVIIHKPKEFVEILPTYFKLSKLASFQRQLNLYGFQRLTRGQDRGGYYHELFLRNRVYLAHSIQRQKVKGTGVRARSNPEQEPDFSIMPPVSEPQDCQQQQFTVPAPISMPQHQLNDLQNSVTALFRTDMPSSPFYSFMSPPPVESSNNDDWCVGFGDKHFHYLDPTAAAVTIPSGRAERSSDDLDDFLGDVDAFFDDFEFPEETILQETNLEDDNVFGDLLEQMIA